MYVNLTDLNKEQNDKDGVMEQITLVMLVYNKYAKDALLLALGIVGNAYYEDVVQDVTTSMLDLARREALIIKTSQRSYFLSAVYRKACEIKRKEANKIPLHTMEIQSSLSNQGVISQYTNLTKFEFDAAVNEFKHRYPSAWKYIESAYLDPSCPRTGRQEYLYKKGLAKNKNDAGVKLYRARKLFKKFLEQYIFDPDDPNNDPKSKSSSVTRNKKYNNNSLNPVEPMRKEVDSSKDNVNQLAMKRYLIENGISEENLFYEEIEDGLKLLIQYMDENEDIESKLLNTQMRLGKSIFGESYRQYMKKDIKSKITSNSRESKIMLRLRKRREHSLDMYVKEDDDLLFGSDSLKTKISYKRENTSNFLKQGIKDSAYDI